MTAPRFARLDVAPISIGARSRLYRLVPAELDSPLRESLASYFVRLANRHHVTPSVLLASGCSEMLGDPGLGPHYPANVLRQAPFALGTELIAMRWAQAIGDATRVESPERMTFLPWAAVLPSRGLIDSRRRHCPACLTQMAADGLVHEPLLWSVRVVTACPVHATRLRSACPSCHVEQRLDRLPARPGLCSHCSAWLGGAPEPSHDADPAEVLLALWVGDVIARPPETPPSPEGPASAFAAAVTRFGGNQKAFAARTGQCASSISEWRRGLIRPAVDGMVAACVAGGWSLRGFLLGRLEETSPPGPCDRRRPARVRREWPRLRRRITAWLRDQAEPPSLAAIERAFALSRGSLANGLRDVATEVVDRRAAWLAQRKVDRRAASTEIVRQVVDRLVAEGYSASRREVEPRLPEPLSLREGPLQQAWRLRRLELGVLPERHR